MSKKGPNNLTEEEIKGMQKALGEVSEEELAEIVGAGGDVNAETSVQCVNWTIQITAKLITAKQLFCK